MIIAFYRTTVKKEICKCRKMIPWTFWSKSWKLGEIYIYISIILISQFKQQKDRGWTDEQAKYPSIYRQSADARKRKTSAWIEVSAAQS